MQGPAWAEIRSTFAHETRSRVRPEWNLRQLHFSVKSKAKIPNHERR